MKMDSSTSAITNPDSFRDPEGFVFVSGSKILRALWPKGLESYRALRESSLAESLEKDNLLVRSWEVDREGWRNFGPLPEGIAGILEQTKIPLITFPFEWSFDMLRDAALLHIDLLLRAGQKGYFLKDASPYNLQFMNGSPIFIDVLSFQPYEKGVPWIGYSQFCEGFLFPLLIDAYGQIDFQNILRSYFQGIPVHITKALLNRRHWLRPEVFYHVVLQAIAQKSFSQKPPKLKNQFRALNFDLPTVLSLVGRMKKVIERLSCFSRAQSHWTSYQEDNSYDEKSRYTKKTFIKTHLEKIRPDTVWDLGCNTGEYTLIAHDYCANVVAFDSDPDCVNQLYLYCKRKNITKVLPLVMDITNPSPGLGVNLAERSSIYERGTPDCILALALIHHLCIAQNIPMSMLFHCFIKLGARYALVEFVPKTDPMVLHLLTNRDDVYSWYTKETFEEEAMRFFVIVEKVELPNSGRILYCLERHGR